VTVTQPTHYEVLGVPTAATQAEVRAAYRAKARDHHPDAGGDASRMQALNAAWNVLGDPARRAAYDRQLVGGGLDDRAAEADDWPVDPESGLTADEWAELADDRPFAPTKALEGWWAIMPPATFVLSVGLFVAGVFFMAPAFFGFAAGAFVLSVGLFVLAPLRAMTRRPPP
jgi:hypothetical protein